jgi:phenylacetate-CoA ligase
VLGRVEELSPHYQLVISRDGTLDDVEVRTEVTEGFFRLIGSELLSDEAIEADHTLRALRDRVSSLIKDTIGCSMRVRLMPPDSVPRSEGGKLGRVVDDRSL